MTTLDRPTLPPASPPAAAADAACAHCGSPVPAGLIDAASDEQFCCAGCRAVARSIRGLGLGQYYAMRRAAGAAGKSARRPGRRYDALDDPAFRARHVRATRGGASVVELRLDGVHCAACLWLVERLPQVLPGVREARLDFRRQIVRVLWDDSSVPLSRVAAQLAALGYPPHPATGASEQQLRRAGDRAFLIRVAVAGALAGNVMLISFALYGGIFNGLEAPLYGFFRWTGLALTVVAVAWPGSVFFRRALGAIRARTVHMDVPVSLGLAAGVAWSAASTIRGTGHVYFDSVTVLVFLLLAGRWIQLRQQQRSRDAVELLFTMMPGRARLLEDGRAREVPIGSILAGQVVEVRAGEAIPVDGVVLEGRSRLDTSTLTGEVKPLAVGPGEPVHAGTTNLSARLRVRVRATGESTRVGRLMRLVEEGARRRAPVVQLADRVAKVFVIAVVLLAAATALLWWRIDPARAVPSAMALLIVTCPCALALATPLAIMSGLGRAARRGILIKGGDVVEALARPHRVLLDKTGTITEGRMRLIEWHGPDDLRPAVAAIERHSSHPVARALACAAGRPPEALPSAIDVEVARDGARGTVDGREIVIGATSFVERCGAVRAAWAESIAREMTSRAVSPVYVAVDGAVRAVGGVGDPVRPGAARTVRALERAGWRVEIASGDHPDVVRSVAVRIGLDPRDAHGGLSPEEKLALVEQARAFGTVVMVGDGVNDAAALSAATVGVAVRGGAEASLAAADVFLGEEGLALLPALLAGAGRTLGVIERNLAFSLLYNVLGAALAIAGVIGPLVAAVLMPLSSLSVIALSFRSRTFEAPREEPPCR